MASFNPEEEKMATEVGVKDTSTTLTPSLAPEEGEILEDDGEVFKKNTGKAEFRALGLSVFSIPLFFSF
jgi:hypothetical protein